jgi:hypothetical protein
MTSGRDESTEKEPVMCSKCSKCSKCNEVFETDSKYIQHYNERHRADEKVSIENSNSWTTRKIIKIKTHWKS